MSAHLNSALARCLESEPHAVAIPCAHTGDGRGNHLRQVGPTKLGEHLESDPAVRGGEPRIAGTRLTVWTVAARLNDGDPLGVLQEEYPDVPAEAFLAAYEYAQASPRPDFVPPWRRGAEGARADSR